MSVHREFSERLSLAAAGGLGPEEERRMRAHLDACSDCASELEELQRLGSELKRLPTPVAPPALTERVRRLAHLELAGRADEKLSQMVLVFLLLFSWTLTLLGYAAVRLLAEEGAGLVGLLLGSSLSWSLTYLLAAWLGGAAAFVLLGLHHRKRRRLS